MGCILLVLGLVCLVAGFLVHEALLGLAVVLFAWGLWRGLKRGATLGTRALAIALLLLGALALPLGLLLPDWFSFQINLMAPTHSVPRYNLVAAKGLLVGVGGLFLVCGMVLTARRR